eukprot:GEMP01098191.1.p1 GENE.GEMP01098191.1~~GEMP01098191.1.p1  ORF type:complete len:109 (-),score=3.17 GEMP01098191.1:475-801(-)
MFSLEFTVNMTVTCVYTPPHRREDIVKRLQLYSSNSPMLSKNFRMPLHSVTRLHAQSSTVKSNPNSVKCLQCLIEYFQKSRLNTIACLNVHVNFIENLHHTRKELPSV